MMTTVLDISFLFYSFLFCFTSVLLYLSIHLVSPLKFLLIPATSLPETEKEEHINY